MDLLLEVAHGYRTAKNEQKQITYIPMPALLPPNIKECVAFIFFDKDEEPIGTGFFLEADACYFVTAKHVIEEYDTLYLRINRKKKTKFITLDLVKNTPRYHWNEAVDIAVIKIRKQEYMLNVGMLVDDNFQKAVPLCEGDDVFFIGLLPQVYGNLKNTPVVRKGTIALVTDEPLEVEGGAAPYFYIEANCYPGNSGSPVFLTLASMETGGSIIQSNKHVLLLGVMYGYINQTQEIKSGWKKINVIENVHIALVSPGQAILDIINA